LPSRLWTMKGKEKYQKRGDRKRPAAPEGSYYQGLPFEETIFLKDIRGCGCIVFKG